MADILFVKKMDIAKFFQRRISRVYPALLFFASVMLIASIVGRAAGMPDGMLLSTWDYISALTFTINYYQVLTGSSSVLGHIWSLCVEEHSYILLALLAVLFARLRSKAIAWCFAISAAAMVNGLLRAIMTDASGTDIYWLTDVRIASVLISVAIRLAIDRKLFGRYVSPICMAAAFALWVVDAPEFLRYSLGTLLLAIAVNSIDMSASTFRKGLSFNVLTKVGVWSYSLYLWQQPFYKIAERMPIWVAPLAVLAAFLMALGSFYLIERPARTFINGLGLARRREILS